jgi:hypothetical protein
LNINYFLNQTGLYFTVTHKAVLKGLLPVFDLNDNEPN